MAESKTQAPRPETDKAGKAPSKAGKATATSGEAAPKAAKAAPKAPKARKAPSRTGAAAKAGKAAVKARKAAPGAKAAPAKAAKAPAKAATVAKATKAPGKAAKSAPKLSRAAAKAEKGASRKTGAKATSAARKVTARTASDAARDAAPPAAVTATPAEGTAAVAPPARPAGTPSKSAERKAASPRRPAKRKVVEGTARSYFAALAALEPASMASYWSREGIQDSVPLGVFRGPEAVRRLYEETFTAMPDMRITVERITADDRVAAVQWRAAGTFSGGPFRGVEPTGRRVELRGIDCLEIDDDGKIVRNTSVYDGAAVARGMGVLPPEDSGAERALRAGLNTVTKLRRAVASRGGTSG